MGKFSPDIPTPPPAPEPEDLEREAEEAARAESQELRKGRVKTILTSGQGQQETSPKARRTVLGG